MHFDLYGQWNEVISSSTRSKFENVWLDKYADTGHFYYIFLRNCIRKPNINVYSTSSSRSLFLCVIEQQPEHINVGKPIRILQWQCLSRESVC